MRGKRVVIPGLGNKALALVGKLSPNRIVMQVVQGMQEERKKK